MTIEEYEKEAISDLSIDVTKFEEYNLTIGNKKIKWARYLFNEQQISSEAEERLKGIFKQRYHYYTFEYEEKIEKKNIPIYVEGDDIYKVAHKAYNSQKHKEQMVEQVLEALDKQSFACNIILKHMMWQNPDGKVEYKI